MKVHYTTDIKNLKDEGLFTGVLQENGYHFAGRILEDVIFLADVKDGVIDPDSVCVQPRDADYFSDFNEKKWLQAAKESFLEQEDEYCVYTTSIQDVYVTWPEFEEGDPQFIMNMETPKQIPMTRGEEVFDSIEIQTNSLYETERKHHLDVAPHEERYFMKPMRILTHDDRSAIPKGKAMLYVDDSGWVGTNNGEPFVGQPALYPEQLARQILHVWTKELIGGGTE